MFKITFETLIERAELLKTQTDHVLDLATETGDAFWSLWLGKNLDYFDSTEPSIFPIPFYSTFNSLATCIDDLIILMDEADPEKPGTLRNLFNYTTALARPHERISLFDEKLVTVGFAETKNGSSTYLNSSRMLTDPITSYNGTAKKLLMAYSRGDALFGGSVIKDSFLINAIHNLTESSTFSKENLDVASDEMIKAMGRSLQNLQKIYAINPEELVKEYVSILESIQDKVVTMKDVYKRLQPKHKRHIYGLSDAAKGNFKTVIPRENNTSSTQENRLYLFRESVFADTDGKLKLLERMASNEEDWTALLPNIVDLIRIKNQKPIDVYTISEYNQQGKLVKASYNKVDIADIIGQEENVKKLGQLLYAFGEGRPIPNIVLYGKPGRGKTMSMRALADCHKSLRTILLSYSHINQLKTVIEETSKLPYQVIAYVDDMHFPMGFDVEQFKTTTCGVKEELPSNFALVVSVNPEAWDGLPESMQNRFGRKLDYNKELDEKHWREVFKVAAKHEGIEYTSSFWDGFFKEKEITPNADYFSNQLNGRMVRDYIREQKAIEGIEFPPELR